MLELRIKPAKYVQDKSFEFVVKTPPAVQLMEAAKSVSGS
jgi:ribosomal protein L11